MITLDRGAGSSWVTISVGTFTAQDGMGTQSASAAAGQADTVLTGAHAYGDAVVIQGIYLSAAGTGNITIDTAYVSGGVIVAGAAANSIAVLATGTGWFPVGGPEGLRFPRTDSSGRTLCFRYTAAGTPAGFLVYKVL